MQAVEEFNKVLKNVVTKLSLNNKTAEVDRFKKRIRTVIDITPFLIFENSIDHIWQYRKEISNIYDGHNYNWDTFYNFQVDESLITEDKNYVLTLISIIKETFMNASEQEKIEVYDDLIKILEIIAIHRKELKAKKD